MASRCRLCTTNDSAALIETVAADLWNSRRHGTQDDWPWEQAGGYWQPIFRELAETAIDSLKRDHVDHS